jgi:putative oxygen-independent coproporphyrinogen III oxidase
VANENTVKPQKINFAPSTANSLSTTSASNLNLSALPPLSLYIHIPWCIKKCPYCDFNSHQQRGAIPEDAYVAALIADLEATLPLVWGRRVHTIFFGGGTPSLFSPRAMDDILGAVKARLFVEADAEITMEANPGTFEQEKFHEFRALGINRLSIGIQSFNATHLQALGRVHNGIEAARAIDIAQRSFDNINLDLMFALPQQTAIQCAADIDQALQYGTNHLSMYHLTMEPNTLFHNNPPPLPDDDLSADMQQLVIDKLTAAGYEHYETSAFSKPQKASRHNLNYWRFGDYIGIGAGAHGKISAHDHIRRTSTYKQPQAYMDCTVSGNFVQDTRMLGARDLPFEFMLNALRLNAGFANTLFTERTGLPLTVIAAQLEKAEARGLLMRDHATIRPTAKGRLFLNDLLELFLPD